MTRRATIVLSVLAAALVVLFFICKLTGVFTYYKIVTPSNEPTLKINSLAFTSIFKKPQRYDFIVYKHYEKIGTSKYIFRLCGLPGDKVQIKDGELFVNGQSTDTLFSTYHYYRLTMEQYSTINNILKQNNVNAEDYASSGPDEITVPLTSDFAAKHNLSSCKIIYPYQPGSEIEAIYKEHWSVDNFGPLVIPEGHYFVLGDNRQNAFDSRYSGLVNQSDFVATVLYH